MRISIWRIDCLGSDANYKIKCVKCMRGRERESLRNNIKALIQGALALTSCIFHAFYYAVVRKPLAVTINIKRKTRATASGIIL